MQIEDYFDFLEPDDIRLRGSRIGIESVLCEFIHRKQTPEEIAQRFHTLTLEQVYATILYYLSNREAVSAYLADYLEWSHQVRKEAARNPSPAARRLRRIQDALEAAGLPVDDYINDPAVHRRIDAEAAGIAAEAA